MSDAPQPPAGCQLLEWDTEFFGRRVARLERPSLDRAAAAEVDGWCRREAVDCLYYLAPADDPETVVAAEDAGYRMVDIRLTFEQRIGPAIAGWAPAGIREAAPGDVDRLAALARSSHSDSRFHADAGFRARSADLFETWIRKSCAGWAAAVLVAEHAGAAAGYCSCHLREDSASIGLIAVAASAQGRGLGRALVEGALGWMARQGRSRATVVTQGRNAAAQRLYQRAGFTTASIGLWYHKWYGPPCAAR